MRTLCRYRSSGHEGIMVGVQIRQAETRKANRLEHKALGRTPWRPATASQWFEEHQAHSSHGTITYRSAERASNEATLRLMVTIRTFPQPVISVVLISARLNSSQSNSFERTEECLAVLFRPMELKRLALLQRCLTPINRFRDLPHRDPTHANHIGVTLS
jgi:hypothetical protein